MNSNETSLAKAGVSERYERQVRFERIGLEGQNRLREARVAVMGCGALGSGVAHNLVRAGVGFIRIVDRDLLEWSNLHRQLLYTEEDVSQRLPKATAAASHLKEINSEVQVESIVAEISRENVEDFVVGVDIVADGLDNIPTRFMVNEACVGVGIPWVYGAAVAAEGASMSIIPEKGPCLRCLMESLPPDGVVKTCDDVGVINPLTSLVSAIESCEVMKILLGAPPNTDLLRLNVWDLTFRRSRVKRRSDCPVCGRL